MKSVWTTDLLPLIVTGTTLVLGVVLATVGHSHWARPIWVAGSVPALALVLWDTMLALKHREAGVDLLALLSIAGAIGLCSTW
jgi:hypothetical protein